MCHKNRQIQVILVWIEATDEVNFRFNQWETLIGDIYPITGLESNTVQCPYLASTLPLPYTEYLILHVMLEL